MKPVGRRAAIRSMVGASVLFPALVSELLAEDAGLADPLAPRPPHFEPKAKRVIFVFSTGGVSHIDTFDPKPHSDRKFKGKPAGGCVFPYQRDPKTGTEVSDIFPRLRESLEHICLVRSIRSAHFDHSEAALGMHTGSATFTRPSMGSWLSYGLGSMNRDLPSFVVIAPALPYGGTQIYANDFLPAHHQGTRVVPGKTPIENLLPRTRPADVQQLELELAGQWDREHLATRADDSTLAARLQSFETAFRLQTAGPEAFDVSDESAETHKLYEIESGDANSFGWQCLVARRLAERGVRFIEIVDGGANNGGPMANWDSHGNMQDHRRLAGRIDGPLAGLIQDLQSRGLFEDTLIVWATEFGRTVWMEGSGNRGRGHHGDCFSVWLAGAGVKGGLVYGATDEIGSQITEKPVEVHDLHATILHLMGMDHTRLTYRHAGRDFRLTDVHGHVVHDWLS